jgi:polyisoprenoid-binding protein YceI
MTTSTIQIPGFTAGQWTIDQAHSHIGFAVKHMMVSKVRGQFGTFSGDITLGADPLHSNVTVVIDAESLDTNNAGRDDHLRQPDFFDVATHPQITFQSTGVRPGDGAYLIDGTLTLRGITKPVTLTVDTPEFGPTPDGGRKAGFSAVTEIRRSDFGITYNGPLPGGGLALSDTVQIILDIEADPA